MKKKNLFSAEDVRQIQSSGLGIDDVERQLALFRRGSNYLRLNRPCTVKDGLLSITPAQRKKLIGLYERESGKYKSIKFVPASGAASRMFADWFGAGEKGSFDSPELDRKFFRDLRKLPFFALIDRDKKGKDYLQKKKIKEVIKFVLGKPGLNFGYLPKALIPFHLYPGGKMRTALEEHLIEAAKYVRSAGNVCHLHFTVTGEYKRDVGGFLKKILERYEKLCQTKFKITFSTQKSSTNTVAADEAGNPVRDNEGKIIFRPGGHGSLLTNLNNLPADFIFVKNIDNIAPEPLLGKNIVYKKMLGGLAIQLQQENHALLRQLESGNAADIEVIVKYCSETLNIVFPLDFTKQTKTKKIRTIIALLNRPLRICAMVRNEGEPGGGPFWVEEKDGTQTLQIVESAHVDKKNKEQSRIWSQAKYFNPVDMVCCIKDYRGKKFVLDNYVDKNAYLISSKNEKGINLRALEVPGLWNGSMAYWNTIFVELPIIVFNPVKTVDDLLRPQHLTTS
jgi:hypothetical protein